MILKRKAWYVAEVMSGREKAIIRDLKEKGFRVYCPMEKRLRRHARKREIVESPVIAGYLFLDLDHDDRDTPVGLHLLRGLVTGVLGSGGSPRPIPDAFIVDMMTAEDEGLFDYGPRGRPNYEAAQRVRIIAGPFAGLLAEFVRLDKPGRARIIMQALGGGAARPSTINLDALEPVA